MSELRGLLPLAVGRGNLLNILKGSTDCHG